MHPQFWTDDVDYDGKEVVVIGSGATAVTLIPSMADRTKHVTMLQRSPTYITSLPQGDPIASGLRKILPLGLAHRLTRRKNAAIAIGFYVFAQRFPKLATKFLIGRARKSLPADFDAEAPDALLQPVGPAPVHRAERRPVPDAQVTARRRSSPIASLDSPPPASTWSPATTSTRTS